MVVAIDWLKRESSATNGSGMVFELIVVIVSYLTTTMYYSYGQRPSPSVDGWYKFWMIYMVAIL